MPNNAPILYTCAQVATLFSVSRSTVSRWVASGRLPCVRIGGRVYIDHDTLMEVIQTSKGAPLPCSGGDHG